MLHLYVRDHEVPIAKDAGIEDINGLMVYSREQEKCGYEAVQRIQTTK